MAFTAWETKAYFSISRGTFVFHAGKLCLKLVPWELRWCSVPPCSAARHLSLPSRIFFPPESPNMAPKASEETEMPRPLFNHIHKWLLSSLTHRHLPGIKYDPLRSNAQGSVPAACRDKLSHHRFISSFILWKEQRGACAEEGCTLARPKDRMLPLKHISVVLGF